MRESHRERSVNSCEYRNLFCMLCSAISKMCRVFHSHNQHFYDEYIANKEHDEGRLYRGLHGVSLASDSQDVSMKTISSFTESLPIAKAAA